MAVLGTLSNLSVPSCNITPGGAWQPLARVEWSHLLSLLVILVQMQPRIQFTFGAAALHCWLMVSLLSLLASGPLHQGFSLPHRSWPVWALWLFIPMQDHACLGLFFSASPLFQAFPCRYTSTSSSSLVPSANVVRVLSVPSSRYLVKIFWGLLSIPEGPHLW